MTVTELSHGRWPGILANAFNVDPIILSGKKFPCPFPGCGGKDRFRFDDKNGLGSYFCNVCGSGNGFEFIKNLIGCDYPEAAQRVLDYLNSDTPQKRIKPEASELPGRDLRAGEFIESTLLGCEKITSEDPVCEYLKGRGLNSAPGSLYYYPGLYESDSKKKFPAMVAKIQAPNGEVIALHRTYLHKGKKAPIESPRKITKPITTIKGAAIRLWPVEPGKKSLALTEGIETALAVHAHGVDVPVWAVISAAGFRNFKIPPGVELLGIYTDNDLNFVGQSAAYSLAARLIMEKTLEPGNIRVFCPHRAGEDFLDEFKRQDAAQ